MKKRKIISISLISFCFLMFWVLYFTMNYTIGTYSVTEGPIKIEVIIKKNFLSFQDTEYKKLITLQRGEHEYDQLEKFRFTSNILKFSLIKRSNEYNTFWIVRDEGKGTARADWGIYEWFCFDCTDDSIDGNDIATFTFDNFKWSYEANN